MLEVEASAKEIGLHAVLKEEIFDLLLDIRSTLAGIVLHTLAVTYFGVPLLAGGQRFIRFNLFEHIVRHEVIGTPWDIAGMIVQIDRRNLPVLFEERGGVRNEYRSGLDLWYVDH